MKAEEQIQIIEAADEKLLSLMRSKGNDYATEDVLSNFKRLSRAAETLNINVGTPIGYALFMCLLKIDRINNLTNSDKTPAHEPVEDSFDDLLGYTKLALCLYKEKQE